MRRLRTGLSGPPNHNRSRDGPNVRNTASRSGRPLPSSGRVTMLDAVNIKAAVEPITHGDGGALDDHRLTSVVLDLRARRSERSRTSRARHKYYLYYLCRNTSTACGCHGWWIASPGW